ncbi:hypothetical protein KIW84_076171 [Lathyrus oleraceus]|uniref:H(+)-exporting diphosphatase n=1 Tax=Pisum sativum TaxID=3888 RepID=A0A9D5A0U7_PEA|nr:hypothetical protein KIW84_076171 [Pisum sativum]
MDGEEEDEQVIAEEVEAMKSVYENDCTILNSIPPHFHLSLKPRIADVSSHQFVEIVLEVHATPQYPKEPPSVAIVDCKGLDQHRQKHLLNHIQTKANELSPGLMLVALCEEAVEKLSDMNHPDGDCPLCLFPLVTEEHQSETLPFMKLMSCFHCFHSECIIRWWNWLESSKQTGSSKSDNATARRNRAVVLAGGGHSANGAVAQGSQSEGDSNNTTIFVGGLDSEISDEQSHILSAISSVGIFSIQGTRESGVMAPMEDPMAILQKGYSVTIVLVVLAFGLSTRWLLYVEQAPSAWFNFALCGLIGIITAYIFVWITKYYTDYKHEPVRTLALSSSTGHGTNIIAGVSLGLESTGLPVLVISFLFRILGYYTGQPLLGAKVVASFLMFATVSGILMALFLNTSGGAWDNAKKYIETGALGGKGSDAHKAAITGDTKNAEEAIQGLNGTWRNNDSNGNHYGGQGYGGHGYGGHGYAARQNQDIAMQQPAAAIQGAS